MIWTMYLYCTFLATGMRTSQGVEIFKENRELLRDGEEKFKELDRLTLSPFGSCWTSVIARLKAACPTLTEETHNKLALGFSSCFMQQLGISSISCDDGDDVSLCLDKVKYDSRWFSAYLQYHTHTHNMCYFLNHQLWLQKTEMAVKKLAASSDEVGRRLEESSLKQQELIGLQSKSVQAQESILEQSHSLNMHLENSRNSMVQVFEEFKQKAEGQQTIVLDMLNKLSSWIQFLVDHVTSIYTVGFYFVISIVLFIVTSTPRTNKARAWLVFLWIFIFFAEFRIKFDYNTLWYARYFGMLSSFLVLTYFSMLYKDYDTLNNRLLNDLYSMVLHLGKPALAQPPVMENQQALIPRCYDMAPVPNLDALRQQLYMASLKDESSDSSSSSDATFIGDDTESDESSASFYSFSSSAASSRSPSPFLMDTRPMAVSDGPSSGCGPLTLISTQEMFPKYNLRPRRSLGSGTLNNNNILLKESPKSFGKLIKLQERNSRIISIIQTKKRDSF